MTVAVSVAAELEPADQSHGWRHDWRHITEEVERLGGPQPGPVDADAIHRAAMDLRHLYVAIYSFKDALKAEQAVMPIQRVEDAIDESPDLQLIADLANLVKHGTLTSLRSGTAPEFVCRRGATGSGAGWIIKVTIQHGDHRRDGIEVARRAVESWRTVLEGWGLLGAGDDLRLRAPLE
jgi:hypothetical protein